MTAVRVRLYPTAAQAALLARTFGCKRFVWNMIIQERQAYYRQYGEAIGKHRKTEKEWKGLFPFLMGVDSIALQQARIDLDAAYLSFFEKRARFPRFKSRKGWQSYRTVNVNSNVKVDFRLRKLQLPKVGWVAYRDGGRSFTERVRSVTVSRTKSGKHFASILIERDLDVTPLTTVQMDKVAAFDMSAREFMVGEGERFENPRFYRSREAKLARLQRRCPDLEGQGVDVPIVRRTARPGHQRGRQPQARGPAHPRRARHHGHHQQHYRGNRGKSRFGRPGKTGHHGGPDR
jgi:putative transposase